MKVEKSEKRKSSEGKLSVKKHKGMDVVVTEVGLDLIDGEEPGEIALPTLGDRGEIAENQHLSYNHNNESDLVLSSDARLEDDFNPESNDNEDDQCHNNDVKPNLGQDKKTRLKSQSWKKYTNKFRAIWHQDSKLKDWVTPDPNCQSKVICRYCKCILRAHRTDLYKHFATRKHKKRAPPQEDEDEEAETISLSLHPDDVPKASIKKLVTEKIKGSDGSYILIRSENGVMNSGKNQPEIFMDYDHHDSDNTHYQSTDQEIRNIANRVGAILTDNIESILKKQPNVLKFFKNDGDNMIPDSNIPKITKICVGHLSQKYLFESAFEKTAFRGVPVKEKKELSSKFKVIEEKLDRTVAEMKKLKTSFEDVNDNLGPFSTTIDFGELLSTSASNK